MSFMGSSESRSEEGKSAEIASREIASRATRRAVYVISVAAQLAGMHPQTLRVYERKGLLDPARTEGGSRRYSEADISQLQRIQDLTSVGVNIEGVRRIIALEAELADMRAQLAAARVEMEALRREASVELDLARRQAAEEVQRTHRQYRRDLVPVRNLPDIYRRPPDRRNNGA